MAEPQQALAKPQQVSAKPQQASAEPQQALAPHPSEENVHDLGVVSSLEAYMDTESVSDPKTKQERKKNLDEFRTPKASKRARVTSPKNNSGIVVSNSFSPLEETPLLKKQAVIKETSTAENASDPVTIRPRGQRSQSAESRRSRKDESRASEDLSSLKPITGRSNSKLDITTPVKLSKSDKSQSILRRSPFLKENFKDPARDIPSQSKVEKTGKNDSKS